MSLDFDWVKAYSDICTIRLFERRLLKEYHEGNIGGTIHTCIGQEFLPVVLIGELQQSDYVFASHRCHGYFIEYSKDPQLLLEEILCRDGAICGGRAGTQHIIYKHFFSNGIQGGIVPNAVGTAFSQKLNETNAITAVIMGDGTLGQGVVYESFNLAKMLEVPILFIVENNHIALSTKAEYSLKGNIDIRGKAFGLEVFSTGDEDPYSAVKVVKQAVEFVRKTQGPALLVYDTNRLSGHSTKDDTRTEAELESLYNKDVLKKVGIKVEAKEDIYQNCARYVDDIFANSFKKKKKINEWPNIKETNLAHKCVQNGQILSTSDVRFVTALNLAMDNLLKRNQDLVLLGEDICEPYGGAFKVTKGLSDKYPLQILDMPISEAGFTGLAVGLCIGGKKVIVEMMFADFVFLCMDQVANHALKYCFINNQIKMPLIIRLPSGGGRGYGSTHSQSTEQFLAALPGITVLAPSRIHDLEYFWSKVIGSFNTPVVIVENKIMYAQSMITIKDNKCEGWQIDVSDGDFPVIRFSYDREETAKISLITYGAALTTCMKLCEKMLIEQEMYINIVLCTSLRPLDIEALDEYTKDSEIVVTVEEGTDYLAFGKEVIADLSIRGSKHKYLAYAGDYNIIPADVDLEKELLINIDKLESIIDENI